MQIYEDYDKNNIFESRNLLSFFKKRVKRVNEIKFKEMNIRKHGHHMCSPSEKLLQEPRQELVVWRLKLKIESKCSCAFLRVQKHAESRNVFVVVVVG